MSVKHFLSGRTRHLLFVVALVLLGTAIFSNPESSSAVSIPLKNFSDDGDQPSVKTPAEPVAASVEPAEDENQTFEAPPEPKPAQPSSYIIKDGDTLSEIFDAHGIPASTLHQLLEADAEFLALETIQPGTSLEFRFDDDQTLQSLKMQIDAGRTVAYTRTETGEFEHQQLNKPMHWQTALIHGDIQGSFYASGLKAGLNKGQVVEISQLLKSQLNFRRDLRAGDTFSVVVGRETTATQATGNTRIEAIALNRGRKTYYAFLYSDGNYYDQTGDSVTPAFLRWPTKRHYRITSSFDPNRLHPITGRHAPHNGVDLGTPSGTPVMSTGDGIVSRIGNHPYAGKYVEIQHSGAFKTRYLHLSKILVKRGQAVKRGQRIALSGGTGRVTGPHLHFEFHVKRHPVNPLTAKIPTSARVPADKIAAFKESIRHKLAQLRIPDARPTQLARGMDPSPIDVPSEQRDWTRHCDRPGQCRYN